MSKEYTVIITPGSKQDIDEIIHYIAGTLGARQAAISLLEEFSNAISSLSHMPKRIKLVDDEHWKAAGLRQMRVRNYYVYFVVDDVTVSVKVLAVIYIGRDQSIHLEYKIDPRPNILYAMEDPSEITKQK